MYISLLCTPVPDVRGSLSSKISRDSRVYAVCVLCAALRIATTRFVFDSRCESPLSDKYVLGGYRRR